MDPNQPQKRLNEGYETLTNSHNSKQNNDPISKYHDINPKSDMGKKSQKKSKNHLKRNLFVIFFIRGINKAIKTNETTITKRE